MLFQVNAFDSSEIKEYLWETCKKLDNRCIMAYLVFKALLLSDLFNDIQKNSVRLFLKLILSYFSYIDRGNEQYLIYRRFLLKPVKRKTFLPYNS